MGIGEKMNPNAYTDVEISGVYRAIRERRDVRHFKPGPLEEGQLARFIAAAHAAPSVGLMQPWRFIRIVNPELRRQIHQHVNKKRILAGEGLGKRVGGIMQLKVGGILWCGEVLVV